MALLCTTAKRFLFASYSESGGVYIWAFNVRATVITICILDTDAFSYIFSPSFYPQPKQGIKQISNHNILNYSHLLRHTNITRYGKGGAVSIRANETSLFRRSLLIALSPCGSSDLLATGWAWLQNGIIVSIGNLLIYMNCAIFHRSFSCRRYQDPSRYTHGALRHGSPRCP